MLGSTSLLALIAVAVAVGVTSVLALVFIHKRAAKTVLFYGVVATLVAAINSSASVLPLHILLLSQLPCLPIRAFQPRPLYYTLRPPRRQPRRQQATLHDIERQTKHGFQSGAALLLLLVASVRRSGEVTARFVDTLLDSDFETLESSSCFQIFVQIASRPSITLDVQATSTVGDIKIMVESKDGIPANQQRFLFGGKEPEDDVTLESLDVQKESTVHVTCRLEGGGQCFSCLGRGRSTRTFPQPSSPTAASETPAQSNDRNKTPQVPPAAASAAHVSPPCHPTATRSESPGPAMPRGGMQVVDGGEEEAGAEEAAAAAAAAKEAEEKAQALAAEQQALEAAAQAEEEKKRKEEEEEANRLAAIELAKQLEEEEKQRVEAEAAKRMAEEEEKRRKAEEEEKNRLAAIELAKQLEEEERVEAERTRQEARRKEEEEESLRAEGERQHELERVRREEEEKLRLAAEEAARREEAEEEAAAGAAASQGIHGMSIGQSMNSIPLKHVPGAVAGLLDKYHGTQHDKAVSKTSWRELTSTDLQKVIQAVDTGTATAYNVSSVNQLFSPEDPDVALSYRWSATLGDMYDGLASACSADERVWIDILFNGQNALLTPEAVLELTPRRYQNARRHVLLVTSSQDLVALLRRGWICFEIAVRMISDKPMVELIDPHRKASELYQSGGLQLDFFSGMETFKDEDKLLIQDAIRKLFTRGDSYLDGADPELNFNRGVGDFVHLTGGKMRVGDLFVRAEQGESDCFQQILDLSWTLSAELDAKGKFADCLFVRECQLEAVQQTLGREHIDVAKSLNNIGLVYFNLGKNKEALEKFEESVRIKVKNLGHDHIDVAASLNNIGVVYKNLGKNKEALEKYEESVRIKVKNLGHDHMDVAASLNNIGEVYRHLGKNKEALQKHEEALRIRVKNVGHDHMDVAASLDNMGLVYRNLGKNKEALQKHEEALRIRVKNVGHDHMDVANSYHNIGLVLDMLGQHSSALVKLEEALRIRTSAVGLGHPLTLSTQTSIGIVRRNLGLS